MIIIISRDNAIDEITKYYETFDDKSNAQLALRNRMVKFINETKTTQREISRRTGIPESVISEWKWQKHITHLYLIDAGKLLLYLTSKGY